MDRLTQWQELYRKPIFMVQAFYDCAYIISYARVKQFIADRKVKRAKKDRKTGKLTYNVPLSLGKEFAVLIEPPSVESKVLEGEKGIIMAFAAFKGGKFNLTKDSLEILWST